MPSTTPDLRIATARGLSGSVRLGGGGETSRDGAPGFASATGSPATGPVCNFASAGHIASKLALGTELAGGEAGAGVEGAADRQPASRLLAAMPDPPPPGAGAADCRPNPPRSAPGCTAGARL